VFLIRCSDWYTLNLLICVCGWAAINKFEVNF
jgi:hypothetical protein